MSSKSADKSKANQPAQPESEQQTQQTQQTQLTLEEDDEFEEFPSQDWDESETNLAHLNGSGVAVASDKLWEDNWDDDDIEDEFSVQLRNELVKAGKNPVAGAPAGGPSGGMQN